MALKQDERALLQLVCERGQSYSDIAELLGIPEGAVREKARAALGELGGADPDREVGLTDFLLGQADPIGRADAVRYLQSDPEAREFAEAVSVKLRAIAPGAQLPRIPEPKGRRRKAASPAPGEAAEAAESEPSRRARARADRAPSTPRSAGQSRMIAGFAAGGVILLFVILAIAGVFSGGDEASPNAQASAEAEPPVTTVPLEPQDGSGVAGEANFGLASDNLFVDLSVAGLDPELGNDSVYVLWLMINKGGGYPVSIIVPGDNGTLQDRYAVPTPVAVAVAGNAKFVQVSESPAKELRSEIDSAVQAGAPLVPFSGTSLASGEIPLAEGVGAPDGGGGDSGSADPATPEGP